jgi:hypothetical protein
MGQYPLTGSVAVALDYASVVVHRQRLRDFYRMGALPRAATSYRKTHQVTP